MRTSRLSASEAARQVSRGLMIALLAVLCLWSLAPAVDAAPSPVRVRLESGTRAKLIGQGEAVGIRVKGRCTLGAEVLEAFVYITQDGFTSQMAGIPLVCDGAQHVSLVRVAALDAAFHSGTATASAYALVVDPDTGQTDDDSPFSEIVIVD
jgi:hypothetical protein